MAMPPSDARLFDIMYTCRAMRRLKPDPVPEETLVALVDAALQAPSGGNAQNWRFIVVRERAQKERLQALWRTTWGFYRDTFATADARPGEDLAARTRMVNAATWLVEHLTDVPALVCVCVARDEELAKAVARPATLVKATRAFGIGGALKLLTGGSHTAGLAAGSTAYPAVQNLLLAARALGLGAVLTTQHFFVPGAFEAVLGIPSSATLAAVIPVGWPMGKFGPLTRPPARTVLSWDRWDG